MKNSNTLKKAIIVLPHNFQELVILKEIKFSGGDLSIELIRELLYLYSIGMEYYDSINNPLLYSHYSQRNINMLINPDVILVLDQNENQLTTNVNINVLDETPYQIISMIKKTMVSNHVADFNNTNENLFNSFMNKRQNNQVLKKGVKSEFEKLEVKLNQIENIMDNDLNTQKSSFENRRKMKQEKMRNKSRKSQRFIVRRGSKLDDILLAVVAHNSNTSATDDVSQNEILKNIMELTEHKVKSTQAMMMQDIEDFIEKNMAEMHKALDELRISFEDEIKSVDEEVFGDVVRGLKEDMDVELENLKDQYDEQRRDGVEKIKAKYNSKK